MSKFKVGDRVRRIRCDNGDDMQVGRTGTIRRVQADGDVMVDVDGGSDACFCMAEYLELVPVAEATGTSAQAEKPKFKVGDRVRVHDHPYYLHEEERTGTIIGASDARGDWDVKLDNYNGGTLSFLESELILTALTIHPGKFYRTRDGRKGGPARQNWGDSNYPWWVGESTYTDSGAWLTGGYVDDNDLVAEADEPPVAEQRAGTPSSTAGFTVPVFDEDDFDICGYRDSDDDIVQLSVGELTAALADSLKVARKVGKTIKRGDLVVLARPALVTGIDRYHASVQTDGGNYSLPLAALTAA